jgi:DNA polymerase III subunit delta'
VRDSDEIIKKLSLKAYEAKYKAMIIWLPEKMNAAAANKVLKILEEPPEKTLFILVSEQYDKLLPTITSRTQLIKVKRIGDTELSKHLRESHALSAEKADQIAFLASGNHVKAIELLSEEKDENFFSDNFIFWMRNCYGAKVPDIIRWTEIIAKEGRERQKQFMSYALEMVRECLLLNFSPDKKLNRLSGQEADFLKKFAPFIHGGNCLPITDELNRAGLEIERNANPKILFLDLSLRLMKLLRVKA